MKILLLATVAAGILFAGYNATRSMLPAQAVQGPVASVDQAPPGQPIEGVALSTDVQDIRQGHTLYVRNCASCHGTWGKGDGPESTRLSPRPRSFRGTLVYGSDDAHVFTTVWLGTRHWHKASPKSAMPGFKGRLSLEQAVLVASYVKHDLMHRK